MIATEEEMNSAKLHPKERDYCAHKLIDYRSCLKENTPFLWRCAHARHEMGECQFQDAVILMKEWEREKRLRDIEIKAEKAAAQANA